LPTDFWKWKKIVQDLSGATKFEKVAKKKSRVLFGFFEVVFVILYF
jgi:hypothetical protein